MHANDQPLEIEVKFFMEALDAIRQRLTAMGAVGRPRVFETNRRYEDGDYGLKEAGKLLRLRRDRSWRLTFKSKPNQSDPEFKIYQELEVAVDDGEAMDAILRALGFRTVQIYEKWRETFQWKNVTICLDTMPFGTFTEIEGSKADIVSTAQRLGFKWEKRILDNYLSIFSMLRSEENLPFQDVTFANFKRHPVDVTPYLPRLYAGRQDS